MEIKDCLYGQVRKLGGQYTGQLCTWLPNDLSNLITKQEIATWNNTTGMNPLHDYFDNLPDIAITKMSYGEMLAKTYDMNSYCVTSLSDRRQLSAAEYEVLVKEDYTNKWTAACKRLAQWWLMHHLLNQDDTLDYDYILLRQIDTIFEPHVTKKWLLSDMQDKTIEVLRAGIRRHNNTPIIYDMTFGSENWFSGCPVGHSYAYILNRSAVKKLRARFYQLAMTEANYYLRLIGQDNYTMGLPAAIMHYISIKENIVTVALDKPIQSPTHARGQGKPVQVDYARLDRTGK